MVKRMGKYKGLPVYLTMGVSFDELEHNRNVFYAIDQKLLFHGHVIGQLDGKQLVWFDENTFNELQKRGWQEEQAQRFAKVTGVAETAPQSAERPVYEVSEPAAADTSVVDDFMANWGQNIEGEIAVLKNALAQMEDEIRAVG